MNKLLLTAIGFVAFVVFIIAMTPASFVHSALEDELAQNLPELQLHNIHGTVWQGEGTLDLYHLPPLDVSWYVPILSLVTGDINTHVKLQANGLSATMEIELDTSGGLVNNLSANVSSDYLNQVTAEYGLDLSGEVQIDDAMVSFDRSWLSGADGKMNWTGGIVHIQTPEKVHTVRLPSFDGVLSMDGNRLRLVVQQSETPMLDIEVKPDGWATVNVEQALVDIAQLPLPAAAPDEGPVIVIEEKIL